MSSTIDTKVVQMKFDNRDFEQNVSESLSTLDKLKNALSFNKEKDAFSDLEKESKKLKLTDANDAVLVLQKSFSALENIGEGIFRKLGADIETYFVGKIKSAVKELSGLNNMVDGYNKYTTVTESVQVMRAATGKSIDEIQERIDTLNWYSDETSYNLTDMTDALAKFVNAGVDMDDAVTAIQGIASWASASGVNAQKASSAFYNLSQAMGSGALKAQDAKSLQLLNMLGPEFNKVAIAAGLAAGAIEEVNGQYHIVGQSLEKDSSYVTEQSIYDSLSSGWLTSDILTSALAEYGEYAEKLHDFQIENDFDTAAAAMEEFDKTLGEGEMSLSQKAFKMAQVAKTFGEAIDATKDAASTTWYRIIQNVIGDLDEASELWTAVTNELWDIFVGPLDSLNTMLEKWKEVGGRSMLLDALSTTWENIKSIFDSISAAFSEIFDGLDPADLLNFTQALKNIAHYLTPTEEQLQAIFSIFTGIFSIIKAVLSVGKTLVNILIPVVKYLLGALTPILNVLAKIGDKITWFMTTVSRSVKMLEVFNKVTEAFAGTIGVLKTIFHNLGTVIHASINGFMAPFRRTKKEVEETVDGIVGSPIYNFIEKLRDKVIDIINKITEKLTQFNFWFFRNYSGTIVNFFYKLGNSIKSFIDGPLPAMVDWFKKLLDTIKSVANYIWGKLGQGITFLSENFGDLGNIIYDNVIGAFKKIGEYGGVAVDTIKALFTNGLFGSSDKTENGFSTAMTEDAMGAFDIIESRLDAMGIHIDGPKQKMQEFKDSIEESGGALEFIRLKFVAIGDFFKGIWDNVKGFFKDVWDWIYSKFGPQIDLISGYVSDISAKFQSGEYGLFDILKWLITGGVLIKIASGIKGIWDTFTGVGKVEKSIANFFNSFSGIGKALKSGISDITGAIAKGFGAISTSIKADALLTIAKAVAILVVSLIALTFFSTEDLTAGTLVITTFLFELMAVMNSFMSTVDTLGNGLKDVEKATAFSMMANVFKKIAIAVLILAIALAIVAKIDQDKANTALYTISSLMGILTLMYKQIGQVKNAKDIGKSIKQMAVGMLLLVAGIWLLGSMDPDKLDAGYFALMSIMGGLMAFFMVFKNSKNTNFGQLGGTIKSMATGILILVAAIWLLGTMDMDKLVVGGGAMAVIMGLIIILLKTVNQTKAQATNLQTAATAIVTLSGALVAIAAGILIIGLLPVDRIIAASTAMVAVMLMLFLLMTQVNKTAAQAANLQTVALAMVTMSGALVAIAAGILIIGLLPVNRIIAATAAMLAIILALGVFIATFSKTKAQAQNLVLASTAMAAIAGAMVTMAFAMMLLGAMSWESIGKAILGMAAIIGVFVIIKLLNLGKYLVMFAFGVSKLATALALLFVGVGAGLLLIGYGVQALAIGLAMFGIFKEEIVNGLNVLIDALALTLSGVIFPLVTSFFVAIFEWLRDFLPKIVRLLIQTLTDTLKALAETLPELLHQVQIVLDDILDWIISYGPTLITKLWVIITMISNSFLLALPDIITFLGDFLISAIESLATWIDNNSTRLSQAIWNLISSLLHLIMEILGGWTENEKMQEFIDSLLKAGGDVLQWIIDGFLKGLEVACEFVENLKEWIWNGLKTLKNNFIGFGANVIGWIKDGISNGIQEVVKLVSDLWDKISKFWKNIFDPTGALGISDSNVSYLRVLQSQNVIADKYTKEELNTILGLATQKGSLSDSEFDQLISTLDPVWKDIWDEFSRDVNIYEITGDLESDEATKLGFTTDRTSSIVGHVYATPDGDEIVIGDGSKGLGLIDTAAIEAAKQAQVAAEQSQAAAKVQFADSAIDKLTKLSGGVTYNNSYYINGLSASAVNSQIAAASGYRGK